LRNVETDGMLIERSVRGRPEAFVEVVRRHEVAVHGYLARRAGRDAADDLLADVWLRAFGGRGGYDPAFSDALPWLYGIARNVLRAHWRAGAHADHLLAAQVPAEVATDPWNDVVARLDSEAWRQPLVSALKALQTVDREVLLLVAWEQLTPAEAALVLGIPQGTARSRLHRARTALRLTLAAGRGRNNAEEGTCQSNEKSTGSRIR
jgi:RNA polymerase sigma factor (sigma-70 family)